jgi:hypothetical protein
MLLADWIVLACCAKDDVALRTLLRSVDRTMQTLGDHLNGMDAVDEGDEERTEKAFRLVAKQVELASRCEPERIKP